MRYFLLAFVFTALLSAECAGQTKTERNDRANKTGATTNQTEGKFNGILPPVPQYPSASLTDRTVKALGVEWMNKPDTEFLQITLAQWIGLAFVAVASFILGEALHWLLIYIGKQIAQRTKFTYDDEFLTIIHSPLRWFLTLFLFAHLLHALGIEEAVEGWIQPIVSCGLIGLVVWFLLRFLNLGTQFAETHFTKGIEGTGQARAIHTQLVVLRTIGRLLLYVLAAAGMLMQFEVGRSLGYGLVASASVAGIALTFAAQRTVATLFAGIQLAFTKTIKIGDVVVVDGNWGTIEDIQMTYVVVKIWDLRRLVVPVTYFTTNSFENWTRGATDLLGTVFLYTDYTVPMEEIRKELDNVLEGRDDWDGKTKGVIVTNLTPEHAEVRITVSATDSSKIWTLRCHVRERMLTWLQTRGHKYLPRQRIEAKQNDFDRTGNN